MQFIKIATVILKLICICILQKFERQFASADIIEMLPAILSPKTERHEIGLFNTYTFFFFYI